MTSYLANNLDAIEFLDYIPADVVLFSPDHKYRYINKAAVNDPEIRSWLIGHDDFQYCQKYNRPLSLAENRHTMFLQALNSKQVVRFKETFDSPGGKKYYYRSYHPVLDTNGEVRHIIGYGFKDTERIKSELELERIKLALDTSKDGIAVLDENGVYRYINKAHATIFEYDSPTDLIGFTWEKIYDIEEADKIKTDYFPLLGKNGFWHGSTRGKSKHGKDVFQDISLTTLPNGGLICVTRDQTEIRKLLAQAKQLAVVVEKTKGMVMLTDANGHLQWVNDSFSVKTGWQVTDFEGMPFLKMVYDKDLNNNYPFEHIQETLKQKGEFQGKLCIKCKDGTPFWMLINISPVTDSENNIINYVLIQLDFNDLHEIESKLYLNVLKEKNLNAIKSKFLNVTSHEIRTPLANIELFTELIRTREFVSPEGLQLINKISGQVKNITRILDDFLVLSRMGSGQIKTTKTLIDLFEFTKDFLHQGIISDSEQRIKVKCTGKPYRLMLDKNLLQMVLKNLIENALKYSPKTKPILVEIAFKPDSASFSITDQGIGIPTTEQDKLFQSFYRASNAEFIQGSGIGLSIVKEFVELMGGSVGFTSEENKFTTFKITFKQ